MFARTAKAAGVDGVLILDYPVEEAEPLRAPMVAAGLDPIFLISPTTTDARIRRSGELGRGFLYVISRLGVTGARDRLAADIAGLVARVRAQSALPVARRLRHLVARTGGARPARRPTPRSSAARSST